MEEVIEPELLNESLPAEVHSQIIRADIGDVTEAFVEYKRVQTALDRILPDCMMNIRGKQFRKKNYWRAVATAFRLTVIKIDETMARNAPIDDNWGWLVTYRATAPDGRYADGDGACFASEKAQGQDTVHNVRGHAHTRAFNRAVSNLVGFGEVSAEEMQVDLKHAEPPREVKPARLKEVRKLPEVEGPPEELGADLLTVPWLDEKLGFGRYADRTWKNFAEGRLTSGRIEYLQWYVQQEPKNESQKELHRRAEEVIVWVEAREMARAKAAQDAPSSSEWDAPEQPPIPESEHS